MRPQRLLHYLCAAITLIPLCAAEARAERYRNSQLHCSLELPEGWHEMAAQEISTINQFTQTRLPGLSYEAGFRPRDSVLGSYPYVLIQLQPAASSYDAIVRSLEKEVQGAVKQIEGKLSDIAQIMHVGDPRLDRTKNRVYMRVGTEVAGVGKVHGLSVGHLGSEVTVWIHSYAVASDFEKMLPTFSQLNDSFAFDEGYAFKPGGGIWEGLKNATLQGGILGGVAGILIVVMVLWHRLKAKQPPIEAPPSEGALTHRQKVDRLIAELEKRGVNRSTVAPPIFRLLWRLGLNVPPPLFLGFIPLMLVTGTFFGIFWGAIMWLVQWRFWQTSLELALVVSAQAGALFGLSFAGYYRWKAAKLQLPSWDCYPET